MEDLKQTASLEEDRRWYVYIHRNKTNNKAYIGITQQRPKRRWQNGYGYKNNQYFWNAIEKYGWDGFEHIIFAKNLSQKDAEHMEILLIALYNTTNQDFGYNFSGGGDNKHLGVKHSDESKKKMSEARIGRFVGENHPRYGKSHTTETKILIGKSNMKPVIQLTKDLKFVNEFESQIIAGKLTGIDAGHISSCCCKKRLSAGGFVWMFKADYNNYA